MSTKDSNPPLPEVELIEAAARRSPGIRAAGVVVRRDPASNPTGMVLYWVADPSVNDEGAARKVALPDDVSLPLVDRVLVPKLPKGLDGRLDRAMLQTWDACRAAMSPEEPAPQDAITGKLVQIYARVLERDDVRASNTLQDLHADSLHLVQISMEIEDAFPVRLSPNFFVDGAGADQTVAGVSQWLEQQLNAA